MAVDGQRDAIDPRHGRHRLQHALDVGRVGVADRVGEVDGLRPRLDRDLHRAAQEIQLGPRGVLGAELHVFDLLACTGDGTLDPPERLVPADLELALQVQVGGGQEGVDPRMRGVLERFRSPIDIPVGGARQARDDRTLHGLGYGNHPFELLGGADGEAGLDDVHSERFELLGNPDLLGRRHGGTRRLLAVPQGGVEHEDLLHAPCAPIGDSNEEALSAVGEGLSLSSRPGSVRLSGSPRARSGPLHYAR